MVTEFTVRITAPSVWTAEGIKAKLETLLKGSAIKVEVVERRTSI